MSPKPELMAEIANIVDKPLYDGMKVHVQIAGPTLIAEKVLVWRKKGVLGKVETPPS